MLGHLPRYGPKRPPERDSDDEVAKRARVLDPIPELLHDHYNEIAATLYDLALSNEAFYTTLISLLFAMESSKNTHFGDTAGQVRALLREVAHYVAIDEAYAHAYYTHSVAFFSPQTSEGDRQEHASFRAFFRRRLLQVAPGWLVLYDRAEATGLLGPDGQDPEEHWPHVGPRWRDPYGFHQAALFARGNPSSTGVTEVLDTDVVYELVLAHGKKIGADLRTHWQEIAEVAWMNGRKFGPGLHPVLDPFRVLLGAFQRSSGGNDNSLPNYKHVFESIFEPAFRYGPAFEPHIERRPSVRPFWDYVASRLAGVLFDQDQLDFLITICTRLSTVFVSNSDLAKQLLKALFRRGDTPWTQRADHYENLLVLLTAPVKRNIGHSVGNQVFAVTNAFVSQALKWGRMDLVRSMESMLTQALSRNDLAYKRGKAHALYLTYLCYYPHAGGDRDPLDDSDFFADLETFISNDINELASIWPERTEPIRPVDPFLTLVNPRLASAPGRTARLLALLTRGRVSTRRFETILATHPRRKTKMRIPWELEEEARGVLSEYNRLRAVDVDRILRATTEAEAFAALEFVPEVLFISDLIGPSLRKKYLPIAKGILHHFPWLHVPRALSPLHMGAFLAEPVFWKLECNLQSARDNVLKLCLSASNAMTMMALVAHEGVTLPPPLAVDSMPRQSINFMRYYQLAMIESMRRESAKDVHDLLRYWDWTDRIAFAFARWQSDAPVIAKVRAEWIARFGSK